MMIMRLVPCLFVALLAACASPPPARAPLQLTILHTNDHHGRFWTDADGEYGLAARKTLVDRIRAEVTAQGGQVLLLDGGDINTGTAESDLQDAEPDFKGMNLLGYDASAVGNHEFDKPWSVLTKQRAWAQFPLLSANIYKDGKRAFEPYRIFDKGGYKIAVIGLTTEDTVKMELPDNVRGFEFRRPAAELAQLLPQVRAKADMVIATTHMGHYSGGRHGVSAPGDVEMAREVPGLDLIVGGHSHDPVCMLGENQRNDAYAPGQPCVPDRQNGTWIVQAHEWGKYVGRADFVIDAGKVQLVRYRLIPVNLMRTAADGGKTPYTELIAQDPAVRAFLAPFQSAGDQLLNVSVGSSDGVFDGSREGVRRRPTNLGILVARSMIERTGADLALVNGGGLRDSLPQGNLSYRDVRKVLPFGGTLAVVELTGRDLLEYLRVAVSMTPGAGGFPHTSGLTARLQGSELRDVRIKGEPLQPDRKYKLVINHFTAVGGDGYPRLDTHPGLVDTGFVDDEVLSGYVQRHSPLRTADFDPEADSIRR
ncbi:MAG: bifunctional UDP-sugar hydrolase/5'-nucleotidase [Paucibacter sp.]|nr:bifunctional UDP-sugar hydrolase/5'-nucleotidase [Roseateles sp.]